MVGAAALFGIRHLAGDDSFNLRAGDAAPEYTGDLHVARAGDGDGAVDTTVGAGFK